MTEDEARTQEGGVRNEVTGHVTGEVYRFGDISGPITIGGPDGFTIGAKKAADPPAPHAESGVPDAVKAAKTGLPTGLAFGSEVTIQQGSHNVQSETTHGVHIQMGPHNVVKDQGSKGRTQG